MKLRVLLFVPPLALAVPAPVTAGPVVWGRLCTGTGTPSMPDDDHRREQCPMACHVMPCGERHRPGGKGPRGRC